MTWAHQHFSLFEPERFQSEELLCAPIRWWREAPETRNLCRSSESYNLEALFLIICVFLIDFRDLSEWWKNEKFSAFFWSAFHFVVAISSAHTRVHHKLIRLDEIWSAPIYFSLLNHGSSPNAHVSVLFVEGDVRKRRLDGSLTANSFRSFFPSQSEIKAEVATGSGRYPRMSDNILDVRGLLPLLRSLIEIYSEARATEEVNNTSAVQ